MGDDEVDTRMRIRLRRCEITQHGNGYFVRLMFMNAWRSEERSFGPIADFEELMEWIRRTKYQVETIGPKRRLSD